MGASIRAGLGAGICTGVGAKMFHLCFQYFTHVQSQLVSRMIVRLCPGGAAGALDWWHWLLLRPFASPFEENTL